MTAARSQHRFLYAAVRSDEADAARAAARALSVVVEGDVAAVTGAAPRQTDDVLALALAHDGAIKRLLACCSTVVPFRLGVPSPPSDDLRWLLRTNAAAIARQLDRFRDRVEIGLKLRARGEPEGSAAFDLAPVRELVPLRCDRQERITVLPDGALFEGVYLIPRTAVDAFWAALDRIRALAPDLAVVGVGPFAPYSFCDLHIEQPGGVGSDEDAP